jgi:hypothetical protein
MDKIEVFKNKTNISDVITTAAGSAMEKLKKYYAYTDALVYTVSTGIFTFLFMLIYFVLLSIYFLIIVFFSS